MQCIPEFKLHTIPAVQVLTRGQRVTLSVGEEPTTRFMPEFSETMVVAEVGAIRMLTLPPVS